MRSYSALTRSLISQNCLINRTTASSVFLSQQVGTPTVKYCIYPVPENVTLPRRVTSQQIRSDDINESGKCFKKEFVRKIIIIYNNKNNIITRTRTRTRTTTLTKSIITPSDSRGRGRGRGSTFQWQRSRLKLPMYCTSSQERLNLVSAHSGRGTTSTRAFCS